MADGYLNICKECIKSCVNKHRKDNIEDIRSYDRKRGKTSERMQKTVETTRRRRKEVPTRTAAHNALIRAVKRGDMIRPDKCSWCADSCIPYGHHADYARLLDVVWLCSKCHAILHAGRCKQGCEMRSKIKIPEVAIDGT